MPAYSESVPEFLTRIYRLAAEHGDRQLMDEMHHYAPRTLRHPDDELRLVANVARGRAKEALHA